MQLLLTTCLTIQYMLLSYTIWEAKVNETWFAYIPAQLTTVRIIIKASLILRFWNSHESVVEDSSVLRCDDVSWGQCFPAFLRHSASSKRRESLTQRHMVTFQKNLSAQFYVFCCRTKWPNIFCFHLSKVIYVFSV